MKAQRQDREAVLKARVDLLTTAAKVGSTEDMALLREQLAAIDRQMKWMASGAAVDASAGNPPAALAGVPSNGASTAPAPAPANL